MMMENNELTMFDAINEWIAAESDVATANGIMVDDVTQRVVAAHADARISAYLIYTGLIQGTVEVTRALRMTVWRLTEVAGQT